MATTTNRNSKQKKIDFTEKTTRTSQVAKVKNKYTRSRKTQVCETNLGFQDLSKEVNELKGQQQELKDQVKSKDEQLDIEKQLNLQLNAKILEQRDLKQNFDRELKTQTSQLQD